MTRKFLVVVDDSLEFGAALHYACRRAWTTGGRVTMLRVLPPPAFEHWAGVREEIEREQRAEAEALLQRLAVGVAERSGVAPEFLIKEGDTKAAIRQALLDDEEIKILVLAAAVGGRGPGPLVSSIAKEGAGFGGRRKIPVTVVPGDLTDDEIAELA
ncbi:universal stress protein [Caulobacter sp. 17J80-11]|uniref:universal stress protein n=1 Tax=Caulobacter sp. 17J80-11 TaxID=2763502 RepID=UPI0016534A9B|nr:universal stress protein [Caulobacter sp. 17J80-11]MBC6983325.1 universal stress protein [Caulobacter sp. 17J80-11]